MPTDEELERLEDEFNDFLVDRDEAFNNWIDSCTDEELAATIGQCVAQLKQIGVDYEDDDESIELASMDLERLQYKILYEPDKEFTDIEEHIMFECWEETRRD
jgi:hypothetical protein